jgi:hypothetical protein
VARATRLAISRFIDSVLPAPTITHGVNTDLDGHSGVLVSIDGLHFISLSC